MLSVVIVLYIAGIGPSAECTQTWRRSRAALGPFGKDVPEWSSSTAGGVQGPLDCGPFCRWLNEGLSFTKVMLLSAFIVFPAASAAVVLRQFQKQHRVIWARAEGVPDGIRS